MSDAPKSGGDHHEQAMALAQRAIEHDADHAHGEARDAWRAASDYADRHLPGSGISHWIKTGLGAALYETGAHQEAILVTRSAGEWYRAQGAVLPSLTIARASLWLGEQEAALLAVREAHALIGDNVFAQLEPSDREPMRRRFHLDRSSSA